MKKVIIVATIIIVLLCITKNQTITIPENAIRFRVIANSNKPEDQNIKEQIVYNISQNIRSIQESPNNLQEARKIINSNIPTLEKIVEKTLKEQNKSENYTIEYGNNYFPEKEYKGVKYKSGNYESLIIKLGDGLGDNFWCVLFPPLCLLEVDETSSSEIEYTSYIKEIITKYFK